MVRGFFLPLVCGALLAVSNIANAAPDDYQVLLIGNSHSSKNDLPDLIEYLIEIGHPDAAVYVDVAPRWVFLAERIGDKVTQKTLESRQWTHVVLQAQKYSSSGKYYYPTSAAEEWIRRIKTLNARPILFPEWPREGNSEEGPRVHALHMSIAEREPACVAPMGLAWQTVIDENPDLRLHARDGNHSNKNGVLLTALVLYQTITGEAADELPDISKGRIDPEVQKVLRIAASNAHRTLPGCPDTP
jgi:hypothetical protein